MEEEDVMRRVVAAASGAAAATAGFRGPVARRRFGEIGGCGDDRRWWCRCDESSSPLPVVVVVPVVGRRSGDDALDVRSTSLGPYCEWSAGGV